MKKVREWMNENSAVVTIVAVVLMLISLGVIIMTLKGPSTQARVIDVYYMDLGNGELFVSKSNLIPPIDAPSGKKGARAFVFSCGECSDESSRFVGWLEMYTPKAKKMIENPDAVNQENPEDAAQAFEVMENGHLVSNAKGEKWVSANGESGFRVMEMTQSKCGENPPKSCFP